MQGILHASLLTLVALGAHVASASEYPSLVLPPPNETTTATTTSRQVDITVAILDCDATPAVELAHWRPTFVDYMHAFLARLGEHRYAFHVTTVSNEDIFERAAAGELDFVLTQPGHVATLLQEHAFSTVASIERMRKGRALTQFGGVFVRHVDATHVRTPLDCAAPPVSIATISKRGFAAYTMQMKYLADCGVDIRRLAADPGLAELGSLPAVARSLAAGNHTCGFLRTDVFEGLPPALRARLVVLGQRTDPLALFYPFAVSTDLYPEWSVVAHPSMPAALTTLVQQILLTLRATDEPAIAGNYSRWFPPASYDTVLEAMWTTGALPRPEARVRHAAVDDTTVVALGTVLAAALAVATAIAIGYRVRRWARVRYAPRDGCKPIAFAVVALRGRAALRHDDPEAAAEAAEKLDKAVRAAATATGCYVTGGIGDAALVASANPRAVVAFLRILRARSPSITVALRGRDLVVPGAAHRRGSDTGSVTTSVTSHSVHTATSESAESTGDQKKRGRRSRRSGLGSIALTVCGAAHIGEASVVFKQQAEAFEYGGVAVADVAVAGDHAVRCGVFAVTDTLCAALPAAQSGVLCPSAATVALRSGGDAHLFVFDAADADRCTALSSGRSSNNSSPAGKLRLAAGDAADADGDLIAAALDARAGRLTSKRVAVAAVHLAGVARIATSTDTSASTEAWSALIVDIASIVETHGGELASVNGTDAVIVFNGRVAADAPARRAARCAFALAKALPDGHPQLVAAVTCGIAVGRALVGHTSAAAGGLSDIAAAGNSATASNSAGSFACSADQARAPRSFLTVAGDVVARAAAAERAVRLAPANPLWVVGVPLEAAELTQLGQHTAISVRRTLPDKPQSADRIRSAPGGAGTMEAHAALVMLGADAAESCCTEVAPAGDVWMFAVGLQEEDPCAVVNEAARRIAAEGSATGAKHALAAFERPTLEACAPALQALRGCGWAV